MQGRGRGAPTKDPALQPSCRLWGTGRPSGEHLGRHPNFGWSQSHSVGGAEAPVPPRSAARGSVGASPAAEGLQRFPQFWRAHGGATGGSGTRELPQKCSFLHPHKQNCLTNPFSEALAQPLRGICGEGQPPSVRLHYQGLLSHLSVHLSILLSICLSVRSTRTPLTPSGEAC